MTTILSGRIKLLSQGNTGNKCLYEVKDCDPSQRSSSSGAFSLLCASVRAVPTESSCSATMVHDRLECHYRQCDMDSMEAVKKVFIILAMRPSSVT